MSSWPDLPRPVRKFRAVPGENPVILNRKFCSLCGRWRLLLEFGVTRYFKGTDEPQYFQAHCKTCNTVRLRFKRGHGRQKIGRLTGKALRKHEREWRQRKREEDPEWYEERREMWRFRAERARRRQGVRQRVLKPLPPAPGHGDTVDSGPFVEWLDKWCAEQDDKRVAQGVKGFGFDGIDRPVADLEDLADLAQVSPKAFWRARNTGRISVSVVDRVLIAAGADVYLIDLDPGVYPDEEAVA